MAQHVPRQADSVHIRRGLLTLHDSLFFASREMGRLYETEPCIHNYALTYALRLAESPYFEPVQEPHYRADLKPLGGEVYVTPAQALDAQFSVATFKYADIRYRVRTAPGEVNLPSYGRAKEIAPGSQFSFYVFSTKPRRLPRWIRLGKWLSKAKIQWDEVPATLRDGEYDAASALNALDLAPETEILLFDLLAIPPCSLLLHSRLRGPHWQVGGRGLPAGVSYFESEKQDAGGNGSG